MPSGSMSTVILHLRKAMCRQGEAGLTDAQLLERFIEHRDEAAFAALVARPGSMVMGVCLRVVRNHQDAEDAFQATFLVLARKAASISSRELLANWLYGVAHNSALKARASSVKRHAKEKQVTKMPDPAMPGQERWNENLQALLDQELSRLPEKYRFPIILCDLGGKTRKEAALQLGCPEGSLSSRLSRARVMLAKRLARHGLTVSGGSLAALLSHQAASVGVPTSVAYVTDGGDHPKKYCRRVLRRKADPWRPGQTLAWQWGVDFRHACGYVHQLAEGLFSEGAQAEAWFRKWRRWLRDRRQGVAQVLRSAMWHYNNRKLAERLKRSGMTWSRAGGQVILDLRVLVLSRMWHPAHAAYLASRPQPSMVPAPSHDRAARKNLRIAA